MILILQPGLSYRAAPGVPAAEHARNLRLYLWTKANGRCALCDKPIEPREVYADHIVPSSGGGEDGVHNLQAVHGRCNVSKSNRPMAVAVEHIRRKANESRPLPQRPRVPATRTKPVIEEQALTVPGLVKIRMRASLSQRELAKLSGVAASTIARLEHGEEAHMKTVRRLAEALNRKPAELMELDKSLNKEPSELSPELDQ